MVDQISEYKAQARQLRQDLAAQGLAISHAQALERVAQQQGARDWNTLRARGQARPLAVGDRVRGRYLGQVFAGHVHGLQHVPGAGQMRITLQFDQPVDVVRFASFSSLRQRVSATIDPDGRSPQRTSDGRPQLEVQGC